LLQIYWRIWQRNFFVNRLIINRLTVMSSVSPFLEHGVVVKRTCGGQISTRSRRLVRIRSAPGAFIIPSRILS